jgi:hypothetical protein
MNTFGLRKYLARGVIPRSELWSPKTRHSPQSRTYGDELEVVAVLDLRVDDLVSTPSAGMVRSGQGFDPVAVDADRG